VLGRTPAVQVATGDFGCLCEYGDLEHGSMVRLEGHQLKSWIQPCHNQR
jgi:hypothetical protein